MIKKTALPLLLSTALFAGPPMLTNDPFTPEKDFEINFAAEVETTDEVTTVSPILDMNYVPIKDILELTLQTSYQSIFNEEKTEHDSFANFEMKYHFLNLEHFDMASVLAYHTFPTNNEIHDGQIAEIQLPMSYKFNEELSLICTPLYIYPTAAHEEAHFEIGSILSYEVEKNTFLLEEFSELSAENSELSYTLNAGYTRRIDEMFSLLISAGYKIKTAQESEKGLISYLGLQTRF